MPRAGPATRPEDRLRRAMAGDDAPKGPNRADAVRAAVDQAFRTAPQALGTAPRVSRERAQSVVEELTSAAGKVQRALDDLRPTTGEDLRELREELRALERRVAALERQS